VIVSTPREKLWAAINAKTGIPWSSDFRGIGLVRGDLLCAAVGYNGFAGRVCSMHSAIDHPEAVNRTFVRAIFEYPFDQCGVRILFAPVAGSNTRSISIIERCGFHLHDIMKECSTDGSDLLLYRMERHECRWLGGTRGKERTGST
jgi:RimJ/RimL family protein N-acetyltransferase